VLLGAARILVPREQRAGWYREWYAEIWHWAHFLAESGRLNGESRMELARHCWGAFADACWLRFNQERAMRVLQEEPISARFCLAAIFLLLVLSFAITGFAPTIRAAFTPLPYFQPERVADLSFHGEFSRYHEGTLFNSVASWVQGSRTAESAAGYSWSPVTLKLSGMRSTRIAGAHVSPNFFEVLGNRAFAGRMLRRGDAQECPSCAVITYGIWEHWFARDPYVVGRTVLIDDEPHMITGVLPASFSFIYPEISVWMLPSANSKATNFAERTGAVLRLARGASFRAAEAEFRGFADRDPSGLGYSTPALRPMESRTRQGTRLYLGFTLLSLLGGFALARSRLAASGTGRLKMQWRDLVRWWGFFVLKSWLLLAVCFVVALELPARLSIVLTGAVHPLTGPISTWFFLVLAMVSIAWSMHDQSRRCRMCLRRLGNEAFVGEPGYSLLEWWGTEMVCADGHGLLYIPELKASWQECEEWVKLDESWQGLFTRDGAGDKALIA